jgi:hypothetical protein
MRKLGVLEQIGGDSRDVAVGLGGRFRGKRRRLAFKRRRRNETGENYCGHRGHGGGAEGLRFHNAVNIGL